MISGNRSPSNIDDMAAEDKLREEIGKLLLQLKRLPRATDRRELLEDIIRWCQGELKD